MTHAHSTHSAVETTGSVIHWAWFYDTLVGLMTLGQAGSIRAQTVELAGIQPGQAVLEVGCGTAEVLLAAARRAGPTGRLAGLDPAAEMLAVAGRKAAKAGIALDLRAGAVEAIPWPDGEFDVVLSSLMMHHLPRSLKGPALAEIRRVLKPGGRLVVVDLKRPASHSEHLLMGLFMHAGLREGVQDLAGPMQAAGFTRVETGNLRLGLLGYARAVAGT